MVMLNTLLLPQNHEWRKRLSRPCFIEDYCLTIGFSIVIILLNILDSIMFNLNLNPMRSPPEKMNLQFRVND